MLDIRFALAYDTPISEDGRFNSPLEADRFGKKSRENYREWLARVLEDHAGIREALTGWVDDEEFEQDILVEAVVFTDTMSSIDWYADCCGLDARKITPEMRKVWEQAQAEGLLQPVEARDYWYLTLDPETGEVWAWFQESAPDYHEDL